MTARAPVRSTRGKSRRRAARAGDGRRRRRRPQRLWRGGWWLADPAAGVLISLYIIRSWLLMALEQVGMLVGRRAEAGFLQQVAGLASQEGAASGMELDSIQAYRQEPGGEMAGAASRLS